MPPSRRWTDEAGSASLEFITAGMILLVPLVYLILVMSAVQAGALAVEGAARQAARVYVQSESPGAASAAAERAIRFALEDYGLDGDSASVSVSCSPNPAKCLTRQGFVTVSVGVSVSLPLVPPVLDLHLPLAIPLSAAATQQVSRFWGAG
jgi:Flp pilus assembly protein TadG